MKKILGIICILWYSVASAEMDITTQVQQLQAALQWSQQQTNSCNVQQLQMAVDADGLRRKVASFEEQLKQLKQPTEVKK